ncbi:MAG: tRNA lysidine(34) synthetase TilS [Actinomycetota bacterium]|nr:tRNA lysidine(34) synthetase TilS [Actinomycetota bacterium]
MDAAALRVRIEEHIRRHDLIPPGGEVTCLVSGGPDSTCLWHALTELGYRASALHVNHGLRGEEAQGDARFCSERFGAHVVEAPARRGSEEELRDVRYSLATDRLRATGHTASDQVETILYRLVASGRPRGMKARREDGIVRPLLAVWRDETEAYCRAERLAFRVDSSNPDTKRGLIRQEILPLLRRLHPAADENLLALADDPPRLPRGLEQTLSALLASRAGSKEAHLGGGVRAVREYDRVRLDAGAVRFGPWMIESSREGLEVRTRRRGDRLAGRRKKLQDVFVDAKVPRSQRDAWPLVVSGEEIVAVPGVVTAPGWEDAISARREEE